MPTAIKRLRLGTPGVVKIKSPPLFWRKSIGHPLLFLVLLQDIFFKKIKAEKHDWVQNIFSCSVWSIDPIIVRFICKILKYYSYGKYLYPSLANVRLAKILAQYELRFKHWILGNYWRSKNIHIDLPCQKKMRGNIDVRTVALGLALEKWFLKSDRQVEQLCLEGGIFFGKKLEEESLIAIQNSFD